MEIDANLTLVGNTINPLGQKFADGTTIPVVTGQSGEYLVSDIRGKYANASMRGAVFTANVTAQTIPVISATMASKFTFYNPPGSGVNMELLDMDVGSVLAATVVNTLGLYWVSNTTALGGTFTTNGSNTIMPGLLSGVANGKVQFYSAYTHAAPVATRFAIICTYTATTATTIAPVHYDFDGRVIVPPGILFSAAMTTAGGTATGTDLALRWMEVPA